MCLTTVEHTIPEKVKKTKFAWKIFRFDANGDNHPEFAFQGYNPYVVGKWNTATTKSRDGKIGGILTGRGYPYGFHCFLTRQAAKCWGTEPLHTCIRQVQIRDVVAFGTQQVSSKKSLPTLVAREMRIVPKEEVVTLFSRFLSGLRRFFRKKGCL